MDDVRVLTTSRASAGLLERVRSLLDAAFEGEFSDDDWDHALGGWHVLIGGEHRLLAHASVVPRIVEVGERSLRAGYVEAVATARDARRAGHGSRVMAAVAEVIERHFEIGVLSTAEHGFYERLGWERWRGPAFVIDEGRRIRTEEEDDGIMVLSVVPNVDLDPTEPIACHARSGDDW